MQLTIDEQTYILAGLEALQSMASGDKRSSFAELREKLISAFSQSQGAYVTIVPPITSSQVEKALNNLGDLMDRSAVENYGGSPSLDSILYAVADALGTQLPSESPAQEAQRLPVEPWEVA